jgi:peptide/nickel transport system substrate-binding protein
MCHPHLRRFGALCTLVFGTAGAALAADGELRYGLYVTLAPRWLDPADTEAFNTPYMVLFAVHDALVKPMPGGLMTPMEDVRLKAK